MATMVHIVVFIEFLIILVLIGFRWKEILAQLKPEMFYEFIIYNPSGEVKNPLILKGKDPYSIKYKGRNFKCPKTKYTKNAIRLYHYNWDNSDPFDPETKTYTRNLELEKRVLKQELMDLFKDKLNPIQTLLQYVPAFIVGVVVGVAVEIIRNPK